MENLPVLSKDLVDELDRMFPEKCPDKNDSERDIWMYSGKRHLVRYLKRLLDESQGVA